jgi:hypothetical protein
MIADQYVQKENQLMKKNNPFWQTYNLLSLKANHLPNKNNLFIRKLNYLTRKYNPSMRKNIILSGVGVR